MTYRSSSKVSVVTALCVTALVLSAPAVAEVIMFQQGADGYERAQDTGIRWAYTVNFGDTPDIENPHPGDVSAYEMWSTNGGATTVLEAGQFFQRVLGSDGTRSSREAGPTYRYSRFFIRFRDVFGTGLNQVSSKNLVRRVTLKFYNTHDLGGAEAVGNAYLGETTAVTGPGGVVTTEPNLVGEPKLNAGTIAIYPLVTGINYGKNDGIAKKGVVTGGEKRRGKEQWSRGNMCAPVPMNDPIAQVVDCGPAPLGNPNIEAGRQAEFDPNHSGAVEILQDATEGFKEFDVTGLVDFITGDGVYVTALSPPGELPTLDINYGQAYRSSEFGETPEDIATRPMLVIELVPEPATAALVGIGGLLLMRRRR